MGSLRALAAHLLQTASHSNSAAASRHAAYNQSNSTVGGPASLNLIEPGVMLAAFLLDLYD